MLWNLEVHYHIHNSPPHTRNDTALFTHSWRTDKIARRLTSAMNALHRYFTKWKLRVKVNKTEGILFTKRRPAAPPLSQFQHTAIPWSPHIRYLGLVLDSKLFFTKHLHTVTCKATGAFLQLFSLLARDSRYPSPINSPCTNYVFALYSHTLPLFGAIHHPTIITDCKFHSPNVSASLAIPQGALPYHVFIPPQTSHLSATSFTI